MVRGERDADPLDVEEVVELLVGERAVEVGLAGQGLVAEIVEAAEDLFLGVLRGLLGAGAIREEGDELVGDRHVAARAKVAEILRGREDEGVEAAATCDRGGAGLAELAEEPRAEPEVAAAPGGGDEVLDRTEGEDEEGWHRWGVGG
ncbi:MAG TPA: hypothetical protein PKW35_19020 [Nannocystaceae bacterium]|nr:hypothetical protein [Nannocystaceae bacterium]